MNINKNQGWQYFQAMKLGDGEAYSEGTFKTDDDLMKLKELHSAVNLAFGKTKQKLFGIGTNPSIW